MTSRKIHCQLGALLLSCVVSPGCVPKVEEQVVRTPQPITTEIPAERTAKREQQPRVTAEISGDAVVVTVEERRECQQTKTTSMEQVLETKRHLSHGAAAQTANVVLAGGLVASGVAIFISGGAGCTTTPDPTAKIPAPIARPCTQKEKQQTQIVGIAISSVAVLPLGALIWNLVRASDDRTTIALAPQVDVSKWKTCSTKPMVDASVSILAGGVTLRGRTNEHGVAQVALAPIADAVADPADGAIQIDEQAVEDASHRAVKLSNTPAYAAWRTAEDRRQTDAISLREAEERVRAKRVAARHEAQKTIVENMTRWARDKLVVHFETSTRYHETCYNRVDTEVPCDGAAAFRKTSGMTGETIANLQNNATIDIYCAPNKTLFNDPDVVLVPHKSRHEFRGFLTDIDLFMRAVGAGSPQYLGCAAHTKDISKITGLTSADFTRAGLGNEATDIVSVAFIPGSSGPGGRIFVLLADKVFVWDGTDAVVLK